MRRSAIRPSTSRASANGKDPSTCGASFFSAIQEKSRPACSRNCAGSRITRHPALCVAIFGTDYPNSYGVATISEEVGLMKKFFATKTRAQAEKYFWRNAAHVYKFVKRANDQPGPTARELVIGSAAVPQ